MALDLKPIRTSLSNDPFQTIISSVVTVCVLFAWPMYASWTPRKTKKIRQALKPEQKYAKTTRTAIRTNSINSFFMSICFLSHWSKPAKTTTSLTKAGHLQLRNLQVQRFRFQPFTRTKTRESNFPMRRFAVSM